MEESIKEISEDMFAQLETLHDDYEIDYKNQTIVVSHPHYMCPKCGDVTCANC
jgi:YgiT-type zinc finger domain-containing protein